MGALGWIIGAGVLGKLIKDVRKSAVEEIKRKNTTCNFNDGISEEEFKTIVKIATKNIKRLSKLSTSGPVVYGTVRSQSGISEWCFNIDYNDYGHITGRYWLSSDNHNSNIPDYVADNICKGIKNHETSSHTEYEDEKYDDKEPCAEEQDKRPRQLQYCPYCGERIMGENILFCSYCGNGISVAK